MHPSFFLCSGCASTGSRANFHSSNFYTRSINLYILTTNLYTLAIAKLHRTTPHCNSDTHQYPHPLRHSNSTHANPTSTTHTPPPALWKGLCRQGGPASSNFLR